MNNDDKILRGNPFKVPENYFEEVTRNIIASTSGSGRKPEKKGPFAVLRPYLAVAASVAVLAIISYTGFKIFNQSGRNTTLSKIPVEEYSEMILQDIDIMTLEDDLLKADITSDIPDTDRDAIIDYLEFENIDISLINDQL